MVVAYLDFKSLCEIFDKMQALHGISAYCYNENLGKWHSTKPASRESREHFIHVLK